MNTFEASVWATLGDFAILRQLGLFGPEAQQRVTQLQSSTQLGLLRTLYDNFETQGGDAALLHQLSEQGLPTHDMPAPDISRCPCPNHYAARRLFSMAELLNSGPESLENLLNQYQAGLLGALFTQNPTLRSPSAQSAAQVLSAFEASAAQVSAMLADPNANTAQTGTSAAQTNTSSAFPTALLAAFAQFISQSNTTTQTGGGGAAANNTTAPSTGGGGSGVLAALNAGTPSPTQSAFGLSSDYDTTSVLNDPSLTVEDKVTLLLMLIMKKMDKDIEQQALNINNMQQQQNGGGTGGAGGGASPSIDIETMKLKRLIDKRSQMFDMLRQIIDKYNQTAKGIIDSIAR